MNKMKIVIKHIFLRHCMVSVPKEGYTRSVNSQGRKLFYVGELYFEVKSGEIVNTAPMVNTIEGWKKHF